MGSDWTVTNLDNVAKLRNGKGLKNTFYDENGKYPVWGANGQIARTDKLFNQNPVIVIGRVGAYCGSIHAVFEPNWVTDNAIVANPKEGTDFRFLYYLLKHLKPEKTSVGSAQPLVTQKGLKPLHFSKPPLLEQRAIAHILGTLDDKIELNRRMNEALEEMARAIFKSWFVDFDPVVFNAVRAGNHVPERFEEAAARYRENPETQRLPQNILDLFPDRFEESELGEIPAGWEVKKFEELVNAKQGKYKPKKQMSNTHTAKFCYPVWGGNGVRGYTKESMYENSIVLLTCRGSNCGLVQLTNSAAWVSNIAFACVPKFGTTNFIYVYFLHSSFSDCISGSAQPQITYTALKNKVMEYPVSEPPIDAYSEITFKLYEGIQQNCFQSKRLSRLRNTLLPKLISGEVRVPEAEKIIEGAMV